MPKQPGRLTAEPPAAAARRRQAVAGRDPSGWTYQQLAEQARLAQQDPQTYQWSARHERLLDQARLAEQERQEYGRYLDGILARDQERHRQERREQEQREQAAAAAARRRRLLRLG